MFAFATGDHHIDEHSRFEDNLRIHWWIADEVRANKPDLFLSGGDIYERASTPTERKAVADWLTAIADVCPVVIVRGNHDKIKDCELLSYLRAPNPIIVEEGAGVHLVNGAAVACLAWPKRAELLARLGSTSHEETEQTAHGLLQNVLRGLGDQMATHRGPKILLAHAMVRASKVSTGQELVGCDFELGLEDLALARADLVLLGHIHMAQAFEFGDTPIVYTGSPSRKNFGETEEKSYTVAMFDDSGLVDFSRVPTPTTPMLLYTGEWGLVDDAPSWIAHDMRAASHHKGAEIRFRYQVDADQRDAAKAAASELRDKVMAVGAISCKIEEVVKPTTKARAPEVAAAHGIADKLVAYWESKGAQLTDDRKARLLGKVQQLEAEVSCD